MIFQIANTESGAILGNFKAASEAEALDLMAKDAGYANYADLQRQIPANDGEIVVTRGFRVRPVESFEDGSMKELQLLGVAFSEADAVRVCEDAGYQVLQAGGLVELTIDRVSVDGVEHHAWTVTVEPDDESSDVTTAERIAARLGDNGMEPRWTTRDGVTLQELADAADGELDRHPNRPDVWRYRFPDGSTITASGDSWDFGFATCWCWAEEPQQFHPAADGHCDVEPDVE